MAGADLSAANRVGANLQGASLKKAVLRSTKLGDCWRVRDHRTVLKEADMGEADLEGAEFGCVHCWKAEAGKVDLTGWNLRGAKLEALKFCDCKHRALSPDIDPGKFASGNYPRWWCVWSTTSMIRMITRGAIMDTGAKEFFNRLPG